MAAKFYGGGRRLANRQGALHSAGGGGLRARGRWVASAPDPFRGDPTDALDPTRLANHRVPAERPQWTARRSSLCSAPVVAPSLRRSSREPPRARCLGPSGDGLAIILTLSTRCVDDRSTFRPGHYRRAHRRRCGGSVDSSTREMRLPRRTLSALNGVDHWIGLGCRRRSVHALGSPLRSPPGRSPRSPPGRSKLDIEPTLRRVRTVPAAAFSAFAVSHRGHAHRLAQGHPRPLHGAALPVHFAHLVASRIGSPAASATSFGSSTGCLRDARLATSPRVPRHPRSRLSWPTAPPPRRLARALAGPSPAPSPNPRTVRCLHLGCLRLRRAVVPTCLRALWVAREVYDVDGDAVIA
jgi:hypothetical protein